MLETKYKNRKSESKYQIAKQKKTAENKYCIYKTTIHKNQKTSTDNERSESFSSSQDTFSSLSDDRNQTLNTSFSDETIRKIRSNQLISLNALTDYEIKCKKRKNCPCNYSPLAAGYRNNSFPESTPSKKNWKIGKHGRKESKAVVIQDPKANESYRFDPRFTCNKDYHEPEKKKPTNYRLRKSIPPIVQPVIGVCSEGKCGVKDKNPGNLLEVRYALVRIHVFQGYTTYEIMKSSKKKPSKMPHCVEGIFVTKRGD